MKYEYQGIDLQTEQRINGYVEATSRQDASRQLTMQQIQVFELVVAQNKTSLGKKITESDLVLPIQELATLSASGVSLIDAINALAENDEHPRLSMGFKAIASKIEGGDKFSDAIVASNLPFPRFVSPLVRAGELSGELSVALNNAAAQMQYEESIRADIKSALTYPLVLIGSGIAAMLIIFFSVVPKFSHMLDGEKELPLLAFLVLSAGKSVNESPYIIAGAIFAIVVAIVLVFKQDRVRRFVLDQALEMPVVGPWLAEQDVARWASITAAMLHAKVSLVAALDLAADASNFSKRKKRAKSIVGAIESGVSFNDALKQARLIPATSMNLVNVGDKTGQLGAMLQAVAQLHDKSCKRKMKQVLTLMEPVAILIVGVLIGIMIVGIVLAITTSTNIDI